MAPSTPANMTHGYRFGTATDSRLEYEQGRGRYKNNHDFSVDFKTTDAEGLIFYVGDPKHLHFVSLYLTNGKVCLLSCT